MITELVLTELLTGMQGQNTECELEACRDFADFFPLETTREVESDDNSQAFATDSLVRLDPGLMPPRELFSLQAGELAQDFVPSSTPSSLSDALADPDAVDKPQGAVVNEKLAMPSDLSGTDEIENDFLTTQINYQKIKPLADKEPLAMQFDAPDPLSKVEPQKDNLVLPTDYQKPKPLSDKELLAVLPDKPVTEAEPKQREVLSVALDTTITQIDSMITDPSLNAPDSLMKHLTEFLNVTVTDTSTPLTISPKKPEGLQTSLYQSEDTGAAVRSFQYKPESLAHSLKIEGYTAKIKVYPPDLGQITANILIKKGMAELVLGTENMQVKQFVESHLQALRDSFTGNNLQLTDVSVHADSANDKQSFYQQQEKRQTWSDGAYLTSSLSQDKPIETQSDSVIDAWA